MRKSPAVTIGVLAEAIKRVFEADNPIRLLGKLEGEKIHETLLSEDECLRAEDSEHFYRVSSTWQGDYESYESRGAGRDLPPPYTSENTRRLDVGETEALLRQVLEYHSRNPVGADTATLGPS